MKTVWYHGTPTNHQFSVVVLAQSLGIVFINVCKPPSCLCAPRAVHIGAYKSCKTLLLHLLQWPTVVYNRREALDVLADALLLEMMGRYLGEV